MEDEKQVPNGYGSVYPNSYWSGIPTPTETITAPIEVVKEEVKEPQTLINKIISIFK